MTTGVVLLVLAAGWTLDDTKAAARNNLDAVRAALDHERAEAGKKQARAAILPQVDLSVSARGTFNGPRVLFNPFTQVAMQQDQSFGVGDFSLGASVNQLIYDGARWWTQLEQAGAQEEAARGQLAEQRLASEVEAVRRFYEWVRAQMSLAVLEATVERSQAQLQRAQALFDAGRVQRRDVLDAQQNVANDRISVLRQRQAIVQARADLFRWLGVPAQDVPAVAPGALGAALEIPAANDDELVTQAKAHRPLLQAVASRAHAAELGVTIAQADNLPRISAELGYSRSSPILGAFVDPRLQHSLSGGLRLSWNLFSGFATQAQIERARVDARTQAAQLSQTQLELEAEVRQTASALRTQRDIAALADGNVALARAQVELEEQRYQAGAGSPLDVRNAQLKLTQAELTQLAGRVDVEIARAALARAVGGSFE